MREQEKKTGLVLRWWKGRDGVKLPACGLNILLEPKKWMLELSYQFTQIEQRRVFPCDASGKDPDSQCRRCMRHGFDPWVWTIPWRRHGNPLQYSWLEKPIDGGAWQGTVHRVAQSQTWLKRQHPGMHKQKRTEKWHSKTDNSQTSKNLVRTFSKLAAAAAAAVAKSLQSCPTLCDPIDGSPPGSLVPGILQSRTLEWVAIAFSNAWKWKVKVKSVVSDSSWPHGL